MEDRYLYKAKSLKNDKWEIGYFVKNQGWAYIVKPLENGRFDFITVDPNTICQCTGLKDKNNNLIWENDIIDRKAHHLEVVKYKDGDWTIDDSYAYGKETGSGYSNLGFYAVERKSVEVIGNIFDNPELKVTAEKPIDDNAFGICPRCHTEFNSELVNEYNIKYCLNCGQKLDWSGKE